MKRKLTQKQKVTGLMALISCSQSTFLLEEIIRIGMVAQRQKQVLKNAINILKEKEVYFDELDNATDIDEILKDWDKFLQSCSRVPYTHFKIVSDALNKDILQEPNPPIKTRINEVFEELEDNLSLIEKSELKILKKELMKYIKS